MKTVLTDRELWFDGKITVDPNAVTDFIEYVDSLCVSKVTEDIIQYNSLMPISQRISVKTHLQPINNEWTIPEQYKQINVNHYVEQAHDKIINQNKWGIDEINARKSRIQCELRLFSKNKLFPLLKALIYIINTLKQRNDVWGTGRGSSVSSYVLYVLEVHDVDSFLYELDITDFIK